MARVFRGESLRPFFSRIWIRLLAFNVLLVFLPAAGLLYLGTSERQMLEAQETHRVLQSLYAIRLDILRVVLASAAVAVVLSLLVSTTIALPLRRLAEEARAVVRDRRRPLLDIFHGSPRHDEIGDLAHALEELTLRLQAHLQFSEEFATDVSHELKNPLASIRAATEVLADEDDPARRRHFGELVQREVARMERLLSGVREISRLDSALDDEEKVPVDVGELLHTMAEGYRLAQIPPGPPSGGQIPPDPPFSKGGTRVGLTVSEIAGTSVVMASPDRLTQVFANVIDNAISFSPPDGVVTVNAEARGDVVLVGVSDQGPGIPEQHIDRIFDRFFSYRPGDPHANTAHTGLGLAIVKAIVGGYGGTVGAANQPGGGARFEIRLPRA